MTIDNKSKFVITHISIDEEGEWMKIKLENEREHRVLVSWKGQHYVQTTWMSTEYKKQLGMD